MKYTSSLEQLSVDMFRSSFDELDRNVLLCQERDEVPQGTLSCPFRN